MGWLLRPETVEHSAIPDGSGQDRARSFMSGAMFENIKLPTLEIEGMTGSEQDVQKQLRSYLDTNQAEFSQSLDFFRNELRNPYEPMASDFYKALASTNKVSKEKDQASIRRSGQVMGISRASSTLKAEYKAGLDFDRQLNEMGVEMLQLQRNFMTQVATRLTDTRGAQIRGLVKADEVAEKPRVLEQQRMNAAYNAKVNNMLAPYIYNAKSAQNLLGEQRNATWRQGGDLKEWARGAYMVGAAVAAYYGQWGVASSLAKSATTTGNISGNEDFQTTKIG